MSVKKRLKIKNDVKFKTHSGLSRFQTTIHHFTELRTMRCSNIGTKRMFGSCSICQRIRTINIRIPFHSCDRSSSIWLTAKILKNKLRLTRWKLFMSQDKVNIVHRKGTNHSNVDAVSRSPFVKDLKNTEQTTKVNQTINYITVWQEN